MSYLFGGTPFDGYARDGRRSLNMGGGGSSGPTQTTTQTSNIPDWLRPQVETALGAGTQQIFNVDQSGNITGFRPYVPYSARPEDYVAGLTPGQTQAMTSAANLQTPGQYGAASTMANQAGYGALGTTSQATGYGELGSRYGAVGARVGEGALGYGQAGAQYGQLGTGIGMNALGYGSAGADIGQRAVDASQQGFGAQYGYEQKATSPQAMQAYMNPYVAASLAPQLELMNQQQQLQNQQIAAQGVKSGAYGGSRQAVAQGINQQNFDLARQQAIAQGYDKAYQQAQQAQQFGATLGVQGLGAGTQALQAGLAGQQVGLQGVQGALAGTAQGMQGAGIGLQGIQGALAGTAQGIQGAQTGLQGVQAAQAGYGLANQAAQNLAGIGTAQLASQQNIINMQNQMGAQQQQLEQAKINQSIQNFAMAQQYPQQQLAFYNSLLRGYATPTVTTSQYQASPSPMSQIAGLGLTGAAAYGMMGKKKGGAIKSKGDGLDKLGLYNAMKGKQ
jgi:hypothetical protein